MEKYESKEYIRSRKAYLFQALFEYLITLMVSNTFLSKLFISIGASDAVTGVVTSCTSLAFLMQLLLIFINDKIRNTKKTYLFFGTLSQFMLILVYLIPFLPAEQSLKVVLAITLFLVAYFMRMLVEPVLYRWANSYVSPNVLAEYSAKKEILSLIGGMIFSFAVGMIMDTFEADGKLIYGFLFIACTIFVNGTLNFICASAIKNEEKKKETKKSGGLKEIMQYTLHNKKFRTAVTYVSIAQIGIFMTSGFLNTFKINELMMSLGVIEIINIAASSIRALISVRFGKYSDKYGFNNGIELGCIIMGFSFLLTVFCNKASWWLIVIFTIVYGIGNAGISSNGINIVFKCVPNDYFVPAMAISRSIVGVCGFLASLVGGFILSYVQNNGNCIFGISVYGQQVLSVVSVVILIGAVIYNRFVVKKQFE